MAQPPSSSYSKYATHHRTPNPKKSALLIIDMQNYFSSIAEPILPYLNSTISLARAHCIPVIFTRHRHILPPPRSQPRNMLSEWWPDLIIDGTFESELLPTLDRDPNDAVVEKEAYSAFRGTGLEERLRAMGIEEVIVAGVMTNLCCETTAREAFVRGFRVFFCTDATGTVCEEMQNATLLNLGYGFAYLVDCEKLKKMGK